MNKITMVERALWDNLRPTPSSQLIVEEGWVQQTTPDVCLKLGFEKVCEILSFEP